MSNYIKATDFAAKDTLLTGNPLKVVRGAEFDIEFNNIAVASATKADKADPTFTGTMNAVNVIASGVLEGNIDGGTY